MATKTVRDRQNFYRYYKEQTGTTEVDLHELVRFAEKNGWPLPIPPDPRDLLAKQFADALREEIRYDGETKRPYKPNHAIKKRRGDGRQMSLWIDVEEASRDQMVKALKTYRDQMVGEAFIGTNTADHWNRINPDQQKLDFVKDFTEDVLERQNAPDEHEEKTG